MDRHAPAPRIQGERRWGPYEVQRRVVGSGSSDLYLARSSASGAPELCLLKTIGPARGDPDVIVREATIMFRLDHPNVLRALALGRADHTLFLAVELVHGKDLAELQSRLKTRDDRLPLPVALSIATALCRGVAHIHRRGILHRDIAPANVLLGYGGQIKVADFGLSTNVDEATPSSRLVGHLAFIAPELVRGDAASIRSDLFSVAAIVWELLTGRARLPRISARDVSMFARLRNPRFIAPSSMRPELPKAFDEVLRRALAPFPDERYESAEDFLEALVQASEAVESADETAVGRVVSTLFAEERQLEHRELEALVARPHIDPQGSSNSPQDEPSNPLAATDRLGEVIDMRYRLESLLGSGGMGAVYQARHLGLDRPVAIKIMHRHLAFDARLVYRFDREARASTRVSHPCFVDVFDVGRTSTGEPYLAMELVRGHSLEFMLERMGPLALDRAIRIGVKIASALAAAHVKGLIHRDLKPANVMIGSNDDVRVIDFGICKQLESSSRPTTPGVTFGSPAYMAPEQLDGVDTGASQDVYAVGCLLFAMLAGRPPFVGDHDIDLLTRKATEPPPALERLRPETPRELLDIIAACLQARPAARPTSMREVACLLEHCEKLIDGSSTNVLVLPSRTADDTSTRAIRR